MAQSYAIKEIYMTIQGEGMHTGRPAVFCRFAGCNLWSGLEKDRATAICDFCDTDFHGTDGVLGGKYDTESLADKILHLWPIVDSGRPFVVCTGGEPLLQLDRPLVHALHRRGFEVAIETNGTCLAPQGVDWICMSPKINTDIQLMAGHELKLIYPQEGLDPANFLAYDFDHFFLQPMDGPNQRENLLATIEYSLSHPVWKVSLQTHKYAGIP